MSQFLIKADLKMAIGGFIEVVLELPEVIIYTQFGAGAQ